MPGGVEHHWAERTDYGSRATRAPLTHDRFIA